MNQEEYYVIDVKDLAVILLRRLPLILLTAVLCAAAMLMRVMFFVTPLYDSNATLIVNTRQDSAAITNDQYYSARNWATTYSIILKSAAVLQPVIDDLNLDMNYDQLSSMISVDVVDNTQILSLTVTCDDPHTAHRICTAIVNTAPDILADKVDAASVKVITEAMYDNQPTNMGKKMPVLLGGAVGFAVSCVVILLAELLNDKIRSEEDVGKYLHLPVLSIIPNNDMEG